MRYYGPPCGRLVRTHMTLEGPFGCMTTPAQGNRIPPRAPWAADNGRFGKGWPGHDAYVRWLARLQPIADRCAFVLAPDIPFDMPGTLEFSSPYLALIRGMGFPVALALQNGAEVMALPWDEFDVAFIAGDDGWKRGPAGYEAIGQAAGRGKPVHMGRVNGAGMLAYAIGTGCSSADGTTFTYGPDTNAGDMLRWLGELERTGAQGVLL